MSLLNDVMRDLQTRGVLGVPPLAGLQPVSGVPDQQHRRAHLLPVLAALTAVSAVLIWQPLGDGGWLPSLARFTGNNTETVTIEPVVADLEVQAEPVYPATGDDLRALFPIANERDALATAAQSFASEPDSVHVTETAFVSDATAMVAQPAAEPAAPVATSSAAVEPLAVAADDAPMAESQPFEQPPAATPAPVETTPNIMRREPNTRDADGMVSRAMQSMRSNDLAAAERLLREALSIDSGNVETWSFLYGVLTSASRPAAAEQALQQGLSAADDPAPLAKLYARDLLERGDRVGAVGILSAHRPAPASDTEYDAFLAALLQQTGEHAQAGEIYRSLLTINPNSGDWQVGLAMSHDSLGYREEALLAFERALASGSLTSPLDRYARRRTVELTANE